MIKYRISAGEVPADGVVVLPENVTPLNVLYHPNTGKLTVVCLVMIGTVEEPTAEEEKTEKKEPKSD